MPETQRSSADPGEVVGAINQIAAAQHGVITRNQLQTAGLTPKMIRTRIRSGRFAPLHYGVYAIGAPLSRHGAHLAAVLACGPTAVLSHRSAAILWEILPAESADGPPEVTVPRSRRGAEMAGIQHHRVKHLLECDRAVHQGIPVTSPLRTLLDLAAIASRGGTREPGGERQAALHAPSPHPRSGAGLPWGPTPPLGLRELEQAVARAERKGLVSLAAVRRRLAVEAPRRGSRLLRGILDREGGPAFTRSEAEERLLELLRRARLPAPRVNAPLDRFELDLFWPETGLAIEVDGFDFHRSRRMFEGDRARDAELAARGIQVMRVTWRQIVTDPEAVVGRVARALGRAEARAGPIGPTGATGAIGPSG
jgi:very-short-patch-repair endonuclease